MQEAIGLWFMSLPSETRFSVALVAVFTIVSHVRFGSKVAMHGPTLLTTAGIFFTFLGIATGLQHFDASNIRDSVPALLGGLKTAFWASVFGVFGALTIKLRDFWWGTKNDLNAPREATVNDLDTTLSLLLAALSSPDGESLVSQVKLLRQDMNDKLDKLRISQEKSLEMLAQMGSKALIEALNGVIREFNNKLTTQFGDNFKKLNEAVGKMVEWQEGYRSHVESAEAAITSATKALQSSLIIAEAMVTKASEFSTTADKLAGVIMEIDKQLGVIAQNTSTLKAVLDDTARSIPSMKGKMEEFVETMTNSMASATIAMTAAGQATVKDMQNANAEMTKGTTELANQIRAQSTALEKEIEKAITASITTLGQQLGTLSDQFATDYQPITSSIRDLLAAINKGTQS